MKKLLALLVIALILISVPVAVSLEVPRQVDPGSAPTDQVYGQGLYLFYGSVVAALTGGNFTAAKHMLGQAGLIHIPPEILDAFNSFNGLINRTSNLFRTASQQLGNASEYISTGRIASARVSLQGAITNLASANQTLLELFSAEPQLAALTGIPSSLLMQKLQPLATQYKGYSLQADRLLKVLTGLAKLEQPTITLAVSTSTILTGSDISVSGRLVGPSGGALQGRIVTMYFGNGDIGSATADASGDFAATLATPFYYQPTVSMFASYVPSGNDTLVYAPATSTPTLLNVTFSKPDVASDVPGRAYAGQPLRVTGTLSFEGHPLYGYNVSLSGFQQTTFGPKASAFTSTTQTGSFALQLVVPTSLSQGTYPLVLATSANGTIGPTATTVGVFVVKLSPDVTSSAPVIAIAGFPLTVTGSVLVNGSGLSGARVLNTSPSPAVDANTSADGSFSFTVTPPITSSNGGWSYNVEVYPSQSWIAPTPVAVNVFVINPLVLLFPASSVGLLAFVVRRRRPPAQAQAILPKVEAATARVEREKPPLTGLPAIYATAAELVGKATSIALQPQTTVREYLGQVRGKFNGVTHFEYITSALESQLYGPGVYAEVEKWAEAELNALRGEIES